MSTRANIIVNIEVPDQTIVDLFITACEGGSNYWCAKVTPTVKVESDPYVDMLQGFTATDRETGRVIKVSPEQIQMGLARMAEQYPHHFQDMVNDNHDAVTADVLLQMCVFGELIYG